MKFAWTVGAIFVLATAMLGQTSTAPEPKNAKAAETAKSAASTQTATQTIAMAGAEGDGNAGSAASKAGAPAATSNSRESSAAKSTPADGNAPAAGSPAKAEPPSMENQIEALRELVVSQSKELAATREQMKQQQEKMKALEEQLKSPKGSSGSASAAPLTAPAPASTSVSSAPVTATASPAAATPASWSSSRDGSPNASSAAPVPSAVSNPAQTTQDTDKPASNAPAEIHYKGITLTPGGFVAAETVTRQRSTASDINTPFNSIPYEGNALAHITESNFTARQSRLSLLAESKVGSTKLTGYWEGDFLGAGVTSNNRQSNSYVFRQRILYGQAALESGWTFTGGQQWSLATETKKGITNRTEVLPMTIDSQYHVGFSWERQYGFRVVKNFADKLALGVSVEGPQATIGGRGFSAVTTTNLATATVTTTGNAFLDAPGSGGGLFNFADTTGYSFNKTPDIIAKAALDPGWGHYELFGVLSTFHDQVYPCGVVGTNATDTVPPATPTKIACPINGSTTPSATGEYTNTQWGGGFGGNLRVPVVPKKLDFALQGMTGNGVGRYGSAQLPDVTLRPDGTTALIRTTHALGELEFHATPKLDFYAYFGGEYAWRTAYVGYDSISITTTPAIPATTTTPAIPSTTTTTFKLNQPGGYGSLFANNSGCSSQSAPSNQLTPSGGGKCAGDTRIIMEGTFGLWHRLIEGSKGGLRWGLQYSYFTRSGWSGDNGSGPGISPKAVDNMVWTSFRYYLP